VAWFSTGLVLSAVFIVVIPPLDILLLVGLIGAIRGAAHAHLDVDLA
jgi:hypothetical protein